MIRVLVCGSRHWTYKAGIAEKLRFYQNKIGISCIIEGEQKGADIMARNIAIKMGIKVLPFPANWNRYGLAAGSIRNGQMLKEGKPDIVLAFHNDINQSKGTRDMIWKARQAGVKVRLFSEEGEYK